MAHHTPFPGTLARPALALAVLMAWTLAIGAPALAAQHDGQGPDGGPPEERGPPEDRADRERAMQNAEDRRSSWENLSEERKEEAMSRAEAAGLFARFQADNGTAQGRYVSFGYDEGSGTLTDYTYHGDQDALFFDSVGLDPFDSSGEATAAGAVFLMFGAEALIRAHNNPVGVLQVTTNSSDATVSFSLGAGASVTGEDNRSVQVVADGREGHLILVGNGTFSTGDGSVEFDLGEDGGGVLFLTRPDTESARSSNLDDRVEALKEGRLGAEMSVVATDGAPVEDASEHGVTLRSTQAGDGSLRVAAESSNGEGRVVTIEIDNEILGVEDAEDVLVELDGEAVERTSTARDVLSSLPGGQAAYHIERVGEAFSLTLEIPGFSEREITVSSAEEDEGQEDVTTPDGDDEEDTPGPGALFIVLAGLAIAHFVKTRRRGQGDK